MTTAKRSGPFYISPGVYHTQITEYSLQTVLTFSTQYQLSVSLFLSDSHVFQLYLHSPRPSLFSLDDDQYFYMDWRFAKHISRAHPTEMICYLLQSTHFLSMSPYISRSSSINLLEIIMKC